MRRAGLIAPAAALALSCSGPIRAQQDVASDSGPRGDAGFTISKQTTHLTEPLMADGTPDYAAVLNARFGAGVTPENNAAILLLPALGQPLDAEVWRHMGVEPASLPVRRPFVGGRDLDSFKEYVWASAAVGRGPIAGTEREDFGALEAFRSQLSTDDWYPGAEIPSCTPERCPELVEWLAFNQEALERVVAATKRPRLWVPLAEGTPLDPRAPLTIPLLKLRYAGLALHKRAMLRLGAGDWKGAAHDVLAGHRLGALVAQHETMIGLLIAAASDGVSASGLPRLAASPALEPELAREMVGELERLETPDVSRILEPWRFADLATVLTLLRSGSEPDRATWRELVESQGRYGETVPEGLYDIPVSAIEWDEALRLVNRWHDLSTQGAGATTPAERLRIAARWDGEFAWKDDAWRSLEPPRLTRLIDEARHSRWARLELARGLVAATSLVGTWRRGAPQNRWDKDSWLLRVSSLDEAAAQVHVGLVALALATYRLETGGFPARLEDLAPAYVAADVVTRPASHGFAFRYHMGAPVSARADLVGSFALTAVPLEPGETGVRAFCVDSAGRTIATTDGTRPPVGDGRCLPGPASAEGTSRPGETAGGHARWLLAFAALVLVVALWRNRPERKPLRDWRVSDWPAVRGRLGLAAAGSWSVSVIVVLLGALEPCFGDGSELTWLVAFAVGLFLVLFLLTCGVVVITSAMLRVGPVRSRRLGQVAALVAALTLVLSLSSLGAGWVLAVSGGLAVAALCLFLVRRLPGPPPPARWLLTAWLCCCACAVAMLVSLEVLAQGFLSMDAHRTIAGSVGAGMALLCGLLAGHIVETRARKHWLGTMALGVAAGAAVLGPPAAALSRSLFAPPATAWLPVVLVVASGLGVLAAALVRTWDRTAGERVLRRTLALVVGTGVAVVLVCRLEAPLTEEQALLLVWFIELGLLVSACYMVSQVRGWCGRRCAEVALAAFTVCLGVTWAGAMRVHHQRQAQPRIEALRKEVIRLEVVAARLPEFVEAVAQTEARQSEVRQVLPSSLDIAGFGVQLREAAAASRVKLRAGFHDEKSWEKEAGCQTADVLVYLAGTPEAVASLHDRVDRLVRLARWGEQTTTPAGEEVMLRIFALPESQPGGTKRRSCTPSLAATLWWAPSAGQELERLQQRRLELQTVSGQVSHLEALRQDLGRRVRAARALLGEEAEEPDPSP